MQVLKNRIWLGLAFIILITVVFLIPTKAEEIAVTKPQASRYAALEKALTGSALVGRFSVTGEGDTSLKAERYELKSVRHVGEGQWMFVARIKYGEHDVTLPLTLPIKWAGDTPVITVDKLPIPGMGTFTARVMIYADHYAGFWQGEDHGGHLFGVVERGVVEK